MSEIYGTTRTENDDTIRDPSMPAAPAAAPTTTTPSAGDGGSGANGTTEVAKDEAKATGEQAKEGARHVAEVGKDEVKNLTRETSEQAKELWQQTRSELMSQSAQQQARVAEGLRSLSEELSSMARSSEQQGVGSDLAQQASHRLGDVAGWLDQRDPGSLVSEAKQFARQRPGTFLAAAAAIGLIGGRLSRGLVADHQDQFSASTGGTGSSTGATGSPATSALEVPAIDHSTAGYSAYDSPSGASVPEADNPVSSTTTPGNGTASGIGTGESFR